MLNDSRTENNHRLSRKLTESALSLGSFLIFQHFLIQKNGSEISDILRNEGNVQAAET